MMLRKQPQISERSRNAFRIAQCAPGGEALIVKVLRRREVSLTPCQSPGSQPGTRARLGSRFVGPASDHRLYVAAAFAPVPVHEPELIQPACQLEACLCVGSIARAPREGCAKVVVFLLKPVEPFCLFPACKVLLSLLGKREIISQVL